MRSLGDNTVLQALTPAAVARLQRAAALRRAAARRTHRPKTDKHRPTHRSKGSSSTHPPAKKPTNTDPPTDRRAAARRTHRPKTDQHRPTHRSSICRARIEGGGGGRGQGGAGARAAGGEAKPPLPQHARCAQRGATGVPLPRDQRPPLTSASK